MENWPIFYSNRTHVSNLNLSRTKTFPPHRYLSSFSIYPSPVEESLIFVVTHLRYFVVITSNDGEYLREPNGRIARHELTVTERVGISPPPFPFRRVCSKSTVVFLNA